MDEVVLVNEFDEVIGQMEKLEAHEKGLLHRAFSVFIFNNEGKLLLQRRAMNKYHSAGLWSNTCCSHPRPDENLVDAARRRLREEMGLDCELRTVYSFIYKVNFENGLTENELDHVLVGVTNATPAPNPNEAMEWKYATAESIEKDLQQEPSKFTYWFKICFEPLLKKLNNNYRSVV